VVEEEDEVYFVGDLFWGPRLEKHRLGNILERLNGHKHLILGNHDKLDPFDYVELGIEDVHTSIDVEEFTLVHDPVTEVLGGIYLVGHVHTLFVHKNNVVNVGVDVLDYHPVSIDDVRNLLKEKEEG